MGKLFDEVEQWWKHTYSRKICLQYTQKGEYLLQDTKKNIMSRHDKTHLDLIN